MFTANLPAKKRPSSIAHCELCCRDATDATDFEEESKSSEETTCRNKNCPSKKLLYGFAELVDQLTMINPQRRPNCSAALEMLDKIEDEFTQVIEGGQ